ncbi:LysR family transcriptional regulator [Pseudomonas sp. 5P_3.1_Bac2]|uniref:LysR family transcriptional regulator n=1 Tax=Pseudomonas sp. 5P_3.1_Bac2 TaxID=2971617 RepID=UPI0021C6BB40|nr:LysR family transcriptional regulator [Pseudomonas sp. 5P_3.1_Bac2]MCU1717707.1 LysR family transcriptional regulator [Pseudomonas sp. 5P_3.1_Bac2]
MDKLNGITVFVQVAETRSFVAAGRLLGVSASAVGKSIARLEEKLGVRLFHRNTRSINLTSEGSLFLERCRRVLNELEAATQELSNSSQTPRGKLRISLPLLGDVLFMQLSRFMQRYPEIQLELDFTDRLVDVVEEGFDAVIRTGQLNDSRLMARTLDSFAFHLVGAPDYFARHGYPEHVAQLQEHHCLHYKLPSTGKLEKWPLPTPTEGSELKLPATMVCNNLEMLIHAAKQGLGIACVPEFAVRDALRAGGLVSILPDQVQRTLNIQVLWPSSRHLTPKLRAFIDFVCAKWETS